MGVNNGKFYDAKKMQEYCDMMKQSASNYNDNAELAHSDYRGFHSTEKFMGMTADAMKNFIKGGTGDTLKVVSETHEEMKAAQEEVITMFETMVDGSQHARIEYDTLEMINNYFKNLYFELKDRADNVKKIVDGLNEEFGNYAEFEQPDSQSALDAFIDFCGGESDSAGYIRDCQNKFVGFDEAAKEYLRGRDTLEKTIKVDTNITDCAATLSAPVSSISNNSSITLNAIKNINCKKTQKKDCYSALAGVFGAVDNMLSDCEGIDTCDNNKKPDWYGIPMKLNGESEQEKILARQLNKTTQIEWNQNKVNELWKSCEAIYDQYGIDLDPRLLLAVICAEGTGSFNTSATHLAGDGQNGVEKDYATDLLNANNVMLGKIFGYMYYHEEYEKAISSSKHLKDKSGLLAYINYPTPIVRIDGGYVDVGVYANDTNWNNNVEYYYEKFTHEGAIDDYTDYILSIKKEQMEPIIEGIDMPQYTYTETNDGQDYEGNRNGTWRITAE